jgi:hypothetical protein
VDIKGNVGQYTSLAILPSDQPAISYYDATNKDLKYAWFDGSVWHPNSVDSEDNVGLCTSLAILPVDGKIIRYFDETAKDLSGQPVISYFKETHDDLKFAWFDGTAWQTTIVHYGGKVGRWSSLTILPSGQPAISCHDESNGSLKYIWFEGFGWYMSTVDDRRIVGEHTSLAILSSGQPAISYYAHDPNYDLRYAWFDGNDWQITTVDNDRDMGRWTSVAIQPAGPFAGHPAIGYFAVSGSNLKYAWFDGSVWHNIIVDSADNTGKDSSLEFLPSGHPAMSYHSNDDLRYAWFDGNDGDWSDDTGWNIDIVDADGDVGYYTSLAILPSGQPAISYRSNSNRALKYAEFNGSDWDVNIVDSEGNVGTHTSLAILPSGQPAISYYSSDWNLMYAWRDGGEWHTTTVDNSWFTGRCTSLVILPSGHPAISYQSYEGAWCLKYAELVGSDPCNPDDWKQLIVDWGYIWDTSLTFLPSGQAAISYYDDTTGDLKYAVGPHLGDIHIDGSVNFIDFSFFASAWRTEPADANWNPECDISIPADNIVDMPDLAVFADNWLCVPVRTEGNFDGDTDVDMADFAILASAWSTGPEDDGWNPDCDISFPADNSVDILDLAAFVTHWLEGVSN